MPREYKILVHSSFYRPELVGIGVYVAGMCEWLARHGHRVCVVCPPPYYPYWRVQLPYKQFRYCRERLSEVDVNRCPLWVPSESHGWNRVLHAASFLITSFPVIFREALRSPDAVITVEPSFFNALASLVVARCTGALAWLHVQDFELDIAFEMGQLRSVRLRSWIKAFESWILRRFDVVSTISARMVERLAEKGIAEERRVLFPNWVDTETVFPIDGKSKYREQLGIPSDVVVALYSGSMGRKHGVELLVETARLLVRKPHITFVICGEGPSSEHLKQLAGGLPNVRFLPLQPQERLNELLSTADLHLLPQKPSVADLVMPSKLLGMLSSGRPIVATARAGTQVANVVSGCGIVVPPEDPRKLADAILMLAENGNLRQRLGHNARQYAVENCRRDAILSEFESHLARLLSGEQQAVVQSR